MSSACDNQGSSGPGSAGGVGDVRLDELIDAYFDRELNAQGEEKLRAGLRADPARAREFAQMEAGIGMLRSPGNSPDFSGRIVDQIMFRGSLADPLVVGHRRRNGWVAYAIAAGLVLAAGAGVILLREPVRTGAPGLPSENAIVQAELSKTAEPAPARDGGASGTAKPSLPKRVLTLGPTDKHEIGGKWSTEISASGAERADGAIAEGLVPEGRIVAVRVGPTWSLWWIPGDAMSKDPASAEQWKLLTRLANPSSSQTPTNATVNKPVDEIDKVK